MLLNSELKHINQIKWKWDGIVSIGGPGRKNKQDEQERKNVYIQLGDKGMEQEEQT